MKYLLFFSIIFLISSSNTPTLQEVMNYVSSIINKNIRINNIKVWAISDYWEHELIPSVSKYLFEDLEINENIAPEGNQNRPGDKHEKKYITVHDTGDFSFNAGKWSQIVFDEKIGNTQYKASFQYIVGNDGIYHNIPDDETAYHAGDGHTIESIFKEYATGIYGNKKKPNISISSDGYYEIEGKKSLVKAPTDTKGNILTKDYFNDFGIYTNIKDGMYYIGGTWYSETYNKIGNYGGNFNSIGIESCVNKGSDIYLTWQRLAKLVAKLMLDYNFNLDQVVQHHYFSGKDCPQTMRTEGYWNHFLNLVQVEYKMLEFKNKGFTFELIPMNSNSVNQLGRINSKSLDYYTDFYYLIIIHDSDGNSLKRVFTSSISSKN